jgi:CRP-like cAMP-binding protein
VLSPDEQQLYDLGFKALRPREFVSLLLAGEWHNAAVGERIIAQGQPVDRIVIPISGRVEVSRHGERLGSFAPGQIMGLALAANGHASSFDAVFIQPGRCMSWSMADLRNTILQQKSSVSCRTKHPSHRRAALAKPKVVLPASTDQPIYSV